MDLRFWEVFQKIVDHCGANNNMYVIAVGAGVVLALAWIFFKNTGSSSSSKKNMPPGPPSLPVIGNLHMLGKLPHRNLSSLAQKYGPIMFLRLGSVPTVVASSAEMAKEFLKTHDLNFVSRPKMNFGKNVMYDSSSLAFCEYGAYWKQLRKVVSAQVLGPKSIESLKSMRAEEIGAIVDGVAEHWRVKGPSAPVDVSKLATAITTYMTCRMTFGRKYADQELDNRGFNELIQEFFYLGGALNIGDFIPWLDWLDLQGLNRRQRNVHKTFDAFLDRILEEHLQAHAKGEASSHRDFVHELLGLMLDKDAEHRVTKKEIKATMLDMLVAGIDTSSVTTEWAMSELLKNPSILKKVQEELDEVVGLNRKLVEESDLPRLEYLRAVVKETLRAHPPVPLLLPRESVEDCTISGYHIPAGSRIIVNVWAISKDPNAWNHDADIFRPERFINNPIDVKGQHFEIAPFGAGRRVCPGIQVGLTMVQLILANFLHCFNWRLADGMTAADLDMAEEFGLSTPREVHLHAVPIPRLDERLFE